MLVGSQVVTCELSYEQGFNWGYYGTHYRVRLYPPFGVCLYKEYNLTGFNHQKKRLLIFELRTKFRLGGTYRGLYTVLGGGPIMGHTTISSRAHITKP